MTRELVTAIFTKLQEHHDALRITFKNVGGNIVQTNNGIEHPLSLVEYDLKDKKNAKETLRIEIKKIQAGIDLETGPLMKLGLFHLEDEDCLSIVIHHLIVDGVSWRIILEDIERLFKQYQSKTAMKLPLKSVPFKVWAEKISEHAGSTSFLKEKSYWRKLESKSVAILEGDYKDGTDFIRNKDSLSFRLDEEKTGQLLTEVNNAFNTEINDILLTALGLGFRATFGHDRLLIALESHGRIDVLEEIDISRTVGWFTCIYPVILNLSFMDNLSRQMIEIKETLHNIPNGGIGYGILKYLTKRRYKDDLDFKLKPQVCFNYLGQFDEDLKEFSFGIEMESREMTQHPDTEQEYMLDVSGMIADKKLNMSITYNNKQFKAETIETFLNCFKIELERIISFCTGSKETVLTPSDLTYKELAVETLERLSREYLIKDIYRLTPMQEGMLFHTLLDESSSVYYEQISYRLRGNLNIADVEKSLNELVNRHDILRTIFVNKGVERPVQVVLKRQNVEFCYKDIREEIKEGLAEAFLFEYKEKDRQRLFDLCKDKLMRITVIRLGDSEYEFIWSHPHILMDGWCNGILISEFLEIYSSFPAGKPLALPAVTPYSEYIKWIEKQDMDEARKYWEKYLTAYEERADVPFKRKNENLKNGYKNERLKVSLGSDMSNTLQELGTWNNVTLNTIIQTIWAIILAKFNDTQDVVFGAVVSGRPEEIEGVETIVGLFINTVPVRITYGRKTTFKTLLQGVQKEAVSNRQFHYYSLAEIQSFSELKHNLFDHIYIFENYPLPGLIENSASDKNDRNTNRVELKLSEFDAYSRTNYDYNIVVAPGKQITINFEYNANIYDKHNQERIAGIVMNVVNQVIENNEIDIDEIQIVTEDEKRRILNVLNNTGKEISNNLTLHQLFEMQVETTPDQIALLFGEEKLTYKELNKRANQLGRVLCEKGTAPGKVVTIMVDRSMEMIVGILGVLKSGGAYLPVEPGYPQERVRYIIRDSGSQVLLTNRYDRSPVFETINLQEESIYTGDSGNMGRVMESTNIAYIIYTSGSTGVPKGVLIEHKSVVNTLEYRKENYNMNIDDAALQLFSYSFDGFVTSLFTPLFSGSKVLLLSESTLSDPKRICKNIAMHKVTHFISIPVLFKLIFEHLSRLEAASLKTITLAGDRLSPDIMEICHSRNSEIEIVNEYGITEASVMSTIYRNQDKDHEIKIGKPIPNTEIYITGRNGALKPVGVEGELYIGGNGLARGYLNNPELTHETFIQAAFKKGCRVYKSGDIGKFLHDGNINLLGRDDRQKKIRGFRIELGEIEAQLLALNSVKEAVVLTKKDNKGEAVIAAYIVSPDELKTNELRRSLSEKLPHYMIPSTFLKIDKIPLNANGKIDRKILSTYTREIKSGIDYVAPANKMEKLLTSIWEDVLKLDKVGMYDNFFDLGGNSLTLFPVINRLEKELCKEIPITAMFEYPTIHSFLDYLNQREDEAAGIDREMMEFDDLHDQSIAALNQTMKNIRGKNV